MPKPASYRIDISTAENLQRVVGQLETQSFAIRQIFQESTNPPRYVVFSQSADETKAYRQKCMNARQGGAR